MCCWKNTQPLSPKIDFTSAIGNASAGGDYEQTPHPPQSHWPDRDGEWYNSKRHYMVSAWGEGGRVWNGSKPSSPSLPEGINCMTVSWLGKEGGESGESLKLSPLSSRRRYYITVSWLGEEGGPTRPYRPGESAMGGCPKKELLSDASGRRVPRGKESEMTKFLAIWALGSACPVGKDSEMINVSGKFGASVVFPNGSACFGGTQMIFRPRKRASTAALGRTHFRQLHSRCFCRSPKKPQTKQASMILTFFVKFMSFIRKCVFTK